ncbi:MAG TPA: NAD(P)-dependent oxidoreductase [Vicinamibacterales bacterium]|jgi:D-3-phosphoglycerate dehydrogenase
MKVLVADKFEKSGIEGLKATGCEVIFEPDLKDATLTEAIGKTGAEVLVVRSTQVTEPMIDAGKLKLIVRAGAGYNTIDVKAASKRGVYVSNCPGKNSIAVAELTFGLITALDRRIPDNVAELARGKWNKKEYSKAKGLYGATLGILGFGKIGQEVAKRAMAFGMNLVIWSEMGVTVDRDAIPVDLPLLLQVRPGAGALIEERITVVKTPGEVAEKCDILTIHLASSPLTKNIVNADVLGRLKPGAYVINTARADVVDYKALAKVVKEKNVRAGVDVYPGEPAGATADFTTEILGLPGVYGTHHIGASTDQAQEAIAAETVRIVKTFKETGRVPNVVNLVKKTPASYTMIVRHKDQPGVLACVFGKLGSAGINAHETENIVFESAEAAIARVNIDKEPPADMVESLKTCNGIIEVSVVALSAK